jgi:putative tryptophan/tyrosine transport system substrate-binding protein
MPITRLVVALLSFALLAAPLGGDAQEPGKVPRVGLLGPRNRSGGAAFLDAFLQGLRELGWVEGQNIVIEYRFAEGKLDRLPDLAAELVRLNVDVILATSSPPAVAAKNATRTISIVMATSADPVELRLVASLARPGGNVTGLSFSVGLEVVGKELELLRETVPKVRRVAVLSNPGNPGNVLAIRT